MKVRLRKFPYNYLPYEERLLLREAEHIGRVVSRNGNELSLLASGDVEVILSRVHRLTYFSHFSIGEGPSCPTQQFLLETTANGCGGGFRQSTRYSTHGLHEYKGKFHPQIARYLMGQSGLRPQSVVLDPFAGSGTVLVEAVHYGCNALGVEANPLAVLVANSKLKLLTCNVRELKSFQKTVEEALSDVGHRSSPTMMAKDLDIDSASLEYLRSWFPGPVLVQLLEFRVYCRQRLESDWARVADALASTIAREVSHQDPADLRIRRRKNPLSEAPVVEIIRNSLTTLMNRTVAARNLVGNAPTHAAEFVGDSRALCAVLAGVGRNSADAVITSPPYATALPYIDTSRLSLVLLGLAGAAELRPLEKKQIGNREISPSERRQAEQKLEEQLSDLPEEIQRFIKRLRGKLKGSDAGFRKQNMPVLLAQYFSDMRTVLKQTLAVLSKTGVAYWLVGPNRTQSGTNWLEIKTPQWISAIAETVGFSCSLEQLDAYQRFGLHQRNGIRQEYLISMHPN